MEQLMEKIPTPLYNTPSQDNNDSDEYQQGDGGRDWWFSTKKRDRGSGHYLTNIIEVTCSAMHEK